MNYGEQGLAGTRLQRRIVADSGACNRHRRRAARRRRNECRRFLHRAEEPLLGARRAGSDHLWIGARLLALLTHVDAAKREAFVDTVPGVMFDHE